MTLDDLEVGMIVEFKNGDTALVLKDVPTVYSGRVDIAFIYTNKVGFLTSDAYEKCEFPNHTVHEWTVIRVYSSKPVAYILDTSLEGRTVIWEAEKEVDWSKVAVDTKIFVRDNTERAWVPRHFAKYEHGKVYVFCSGNTEFTNEGDAPVTFKYAKLAD